MAKHGGGGKVPEIVEGTVKKFMKKADPPRGRGGPDAPHGPQGPNPSSPHPDISHRVSQKQNRHLKDNPNYGNGGYLNSQQDAQSVLDAVHNGEATVLGHTKEGHLLVSYPEVTGYNNNPGAGYLDQPTNVFVIKGDEPPERRAHLPECESPLMTENDAVIQVGQAFFGLVTPDIRAVALDHSPEAFTIYVALARDTAEVREDLDDMVGDLEAALLPQDPDITVVAEVTTTGPEWQGRRHRLVLLLKQGT